MGEMPAFADDFNRYPFNRPYGDAIGAYVDPDEIEALKKTHPINIVKKLARQSAALRLIDDMAARPDADREMLTILRYLVAG
jgi:hypothetical protein